MGPSKRGLIRIQIFEMRVLRYVKNGSRSDRVNNDTIRHEFGISSILHRMVNIELGGKRILIGCNQIGFNDKFYITFRRATEICKDPVKGSLTLETGAGDASLNHGQK